VPGVMSRMMVPLRVKRGFAEALTVRRWQILAPRSWPARMIGYLGSSERRIERMAFPTLPWCAG
jgi:hypothetical protein